MRLIEMTRKVVEILREAGEQGYLSPELAQKLKIPQRRIYDIVAVLKALDLIKTIRERRGTRIIWKTELHLQKEKELLLKALKRERELRRKIEKRFLSLREKLEAIGEEKLISAYKAVKFNVNQIKIKCERGCITVSHRGREVIAKSMVPGIIVQPLPAYAPIRILKSAKTLKSE